MSVANDVFKTAEVWKSPRGVEYTVLYVHHDGFSKPVARLKKSGGTSRSRAIARWHNDTNGWTLVRSAKEAGV